MYPEFLARVSAIILFFGFNLTFFPQFILGYLGMPRRYHSYPPEFQVLNVMSTAGASILALGYLLPMIYLVWSLKYGPVAGPNPWPATGTGMENRFAATDREFPGNSGSHVGAVRFRTPPGSGFKSRLNRSIAAAGARRRLIDLNVGAGWHLSAAPANLRF